MKKITLMLMLVLLAGLSRAQVKLSTDRLRELLYQSESVNFSEKIQAEVKLFSERKDVDPRIVTKNLIFLKALYNSEISIGERLALCDLVIQQFDRDLPMKSISFPLDMVKKLKQELLHLK